MNKKGELTFQMIVLAALALVALVVMAGLFSNTIGNIMKKIFGIGEESTPEELKKSCSFLGGKCTSLKDCKGRILPKPSDGWKENCEVCCAS